MAARPPPNRRRHDWMKPLPSDVKEKLQDYAIKSVERELLEGIMKLKLPVLDVVVSGDEWQGKFSVTTIVFGKSVYISTQYGTTLDGWTMSGYFDRDYPYSILDFVKGKSSNYVFDWLEKASMGFFPELPPWTIESHKQIETMTVEELKEGYSFLLATIDELKEEIEQLNERWEQRNDIADHLVEPYRREVNEFLTQIVTEDGVQAAYNRLAARFNQARYEVWKRSYPKKWRTATEVIRKFCEDHAEYSFDVYEIWKDSAIR